MWAIPTSAFLHAPPEAFSDIGCSCCTAYPTADCLPSLSDPGAIVGLYPPPEDRLDIFDALDDILDEDANLPPSHAHGFRLAAGADLTELFLLTEIPGASAYSVGVLSADGDVEPATPVEPGEWISPYHQLGAHESAWEVSAGESRLHFMVERPGDTSLEFTLGWGV